MLNAGGIITQIIVRESAQNDSMIFEVRFADEAGKAEIWEPYGPAPLATILDDGNAGEHAAKLIQAWFPGAELE